MFFSIISVPHFPAVIYADGLHDGQSEPAAGSFLRRTIEAVEYQPGIQGWLVGGVRYYEPPAGQDDGYLPVRTVVTDSSLSSSIISSFIAFDE